MYGDNKDECEDVKVVTALPDNQLVTTALVNEFGIWQFKTVVWDRDHDRKIKEEGHGFDQRKALEYHLKITEKPQ